MKYRYDCIFYIVDNSIYIYSFKKNNIVVNNYSNYIKNGRIIKPKIIIKIINEYLKKEKLYKILSTLNAIIIYDSHLTYIDKKIIVDIFENCNFKDIKLIDTKNLLNKNNYYIEINNNYLLTYYHNKYEYIQFNNYFSIKSIINKIVKQNNKDIYLFGINDDILTLANISNKLYYIENYSSYLIDKIKDKNSKQN